uniref:RRM domain-containing protein n=1 Tax=Angiostrongylus cantonensis TaxID=6313 RepID=A0A0K0DKI0_ANGCA
LQELSSIEQQMEEFEEEQRKIKQMQSDIEGQMNLPRSSNGTNSPVILSPEEKAEADSRSVYIGNVDYSVTAEELEKHFHGCGSVARVTILCDKYTGHPKGFAYAEFADKEGMQMALAMSDSLLKGRQIKVMEKRTNRPGISTTNRPPRGRGFGGAPPGYIIKYVPVGGYRARGARGLRRPRGFHPYT